jgi:pimeloyl-ACP methyl ester carboxylesterase
MTTSKASARQYLDRPEGRIAYDDRGSGPLVVLVPGMGDVRSTYRYQAEPLADAGFRVVTIDLRGHGDSDASFSSYDDEALASDLVALVEKLGGPATVVGNSMGAGAAVIAAAARPELFARLALVGAFVRDPRLSAVTRTAFRVLTSRPLARTVWRYYLPTLYAGRKPEDFDAYRAEVHAAMGRPGYARAFSATAHTTHAPAEAAASSVRAPVLVVMGAGDPDFPDPVDEGRWIVSAVGGPATAITVDDAGHYPHSQQPDAVNAALLDFLSTEPPVA